MKYMRNANEIMDKIDELIQDVKNKNYSLSKKKDIIAQINVLQWVLDDSKDLKT